jgi:hypothetical protein
MYQLNIVSSYDKFLLGSVWRREIIVYHVAFVNKILVLNRKRFVPDGKSIREGVVVGYYSTIIINRV